MTTGGNFNDQALITAVLSVGADRIMFASDYPYDMATDAARRIEEEMDYPGQIKVTVIRETRAIDYAK